MTTEVSLDISTTGASLDTSATGVSLDTSTAGTAFDVSTTGSGASINASTAGVSLDIIDFTISTNEASSSSGVSTKSTDASEDSKVLMAQLTLLRMLLPTSKSKVCSLFDGCTSGSSSDLTFSSISTLLGNEVEDVSVITNDSRTLFTSSSVILDPPIKAANPSLVSLMTEELDAFWGLMLVEGTISATGISFKSMVFKTSVMISLMSSET